MGFARLPPAGRVPWLEHPRVMPRGNPASWAKPPAAPPLLHRSRGDEFSGGSSVGSPRTPHRSNTGSAAGSPFMQARRAGEGAAGPAEAAAGREVGGPGAWRGAGGAGRRLSPRCQLRAAGPAEQAPSPARSAPHRSRRRRPARAAA